MIILQVEHRVLNFDEWKKAFDSDPINRKKSGVRRYSIYRPIDDPKYVVIDLEFDNLKEAENTLTALRNLWGKLEGTVIMYPQTRIFDRVETTEV